MTDQSVVAGYGRALARRGQPVIFIRLNGQAPNAQEVRVTVNAVVMDYQPITPEGAFAKEGQITQGDRMIIVLASDLETQYFPLPLRKNDKIVVQGEMLNITQIDPNKRLIAGAIEIKARGVA